MSSTASLTSSKTITEIAHAINEIESHPDTNDISITVNSTSTSNIKQAIDPQTQAEIKPDDITTNTLIEITPEGYYPSGYLTRTETGYEYALGESTDCFSEMPIKNSCNDINVAIREIKEFLLSTILAEQNSKY